MWRRAYVYSPTVIYKDIEKPAENAYSFFKKSLDFEPEIAEYWHDRIKKNLARERRQTAASMRREARQARIERDASVQGQRDLNAQRVWASGRNNR